MQTQMLFNYLLEHGFSIALVITSITLCFFTWRLAVETRKLGRIQVEPRVSVRAEYDRSEKAYELVIANEGRGVAKNLQCEFEGDSAHFRDSLVFKNATPVDKLHFVTHGIEQLESGQSYRYLIGGTSIEGFELAATSPWVFRLQYENDYGKKHKDLQRVEFSLFKGDFPPPNRIKEISTTLKKIHETLNKQE